MKKLKFVSAGYENYTGPIGMFDFVDGVSVEVINRVSRDRLCTAFDFVEIDEDGSETPSGVAHRLVADAANRQDVIPELERQTEEEAKAEARADALKAKINPAGVLFTHTELAKIGDREGLKGLRVIGDKWNVRQRAIEPLILLILEAQNKYLDARDERVAAAIVQEQIGDVEAAASAPAPAPAPAPDLGELIEAASVSIGEALIVAEALIVVETPADVEAPAVVEAEAAAE